MQMNLFNQLSRIHSDFCGQFMLLGVINAYYPSEIYKLLACQGVKKFCMENRERKLTRLSLLLLVVKYRLDLLLLCNRPIMSLIVTKNVELFEAIFTTFF